MAKSKGSASVLVLVNSQFQNILKFLSVATAFGPNLLSALSSGVGDRFGDGFRSPDPNRRFYPLGRCLAVPIGSSVSTSLIQRKNWQRFGYRRSAVGHLGMKVGWSRSRGVATSNQRCALAAENGSASPETTSKRLPPLID